MCFGPFRVFLLHRLRVPLSAVEDMPQLSVVVKVIDECCVDDPRAEVPRTSELVHELGLFV
jgi:hypothetical protein